MLTEYYSGDQIKKNATGAGRGRKGGQERRRPLGKPRVRWEDNIKLNLREVG
jgi:hypothetical protein